MSVAVLCLLAAVAIAACVAQVLSGVYVDQDAVDDELVDIILAPAFTPNALDVFVSVITGGGALAEGGAGGGLLGSQG
jgi:hypothetical protein